MSLPYENATSGEKALSDLQAILAKFGCGTFGTMTDAEQGKTLVQFKWRERQVSVEASWKGYAAAWLKKHPYTYRMRQSRAQHEQRALKQGQISVCSILRDWVKGQVMAVECGLMDFESAFMPHMLLPSGERLIDRVRSQILALPERSES